MALANLKQFIYQKDLCLMIVGIYKMYINIKNRTCIHFDGLIKSEKTETKNILINKNTSKIRPFVLLDMLTIIQ